MEEILELAKKAADEAEVFQINSEETPVHFEANRLKNIQSKESTSVSLRIIKNGKLGYAAASGSIEPQKLVDIAVETAQFGMPAKFVFPENTTFPTVKVHDPAVAKVSIAEMIDLGQAMIEPVLKSTPGIMCDAAVSKDTLTMKVINSRGGQAAYRKSTFGLGLGGTLIRDTDMLFVGEGDESCHPIKDIKKITSVVLLQLERARNTAPIKSGELPVIFTPDGVVSAFLPALMAALSGKTVLEGASPLGKKLGEKVVDAQFSLFDDPTIDYAPHSRPCDDEGVPSRRTPLIEKGVVRNFLYDLQTAGLAKAKTTGSGGRGRGGIMSPSASAWIIDAGKTAFADMLQDIQEGLLIEQLMGAEQGNVLAGDFSGNVLLGYKIEKGRIVGRVKDTMVSGNVYKILKDNATLGKEARWVNGAIYTPHIYCHSLSVASK
jgi:PmbA protein